MYRDFPINNTFIETVLIKCKASEEPTGSLIYLPNSYLSAYLKVKYGDANLTALTRLNYLPNLLNTWASSVNFFVNGVNIGITSSFNVKMSYILNLFRIGMNKRKDLAGIHLGWLNTLDSGTNNGNTSLNKGLVSR